MRMKLSVLACAFLLQACEVSEEFKATDLTTNVIDEANLNGLMLRAGDPNESVAYFRQLVAQQPERMDLKRGFALSLIRARRYADAETVYRKIDAASAMTNEDLEEMAFVQSHLGDWKGVRTHLDRITTDPRSSRQLLLQALSHDQAKEWAAADASYERALQRTSRPAVIYNNWGVSKLARGDSVQAVTAFERALRLKPDFVQAKANLVLSEGVARNYNLPSVPMTESERAVYLHDLGLLAQRHGELKKAAALFQQAADLHPRYYASAISKLEKLESQGVTQ